MPAGLKIELGSPKLIGWPRKEDYLQKHLPFLLAPRCPASLSNQLGCMRHLAAPESIRWLAVENAEAYDLELTGLPRRSVPSSKVECSASSAFDGRRICQAPWPEKWPLAHGRPYQLRVVARKGIQRAHSGNTKLELHANGEQVRTALAALPALDPVSLALAKARIYAGAGLSNEAVAFLEKAVAEVPSDLLRLELGRAYRQIDALEPSSAVLSEVFQSEDPPGSADFEFGLTLIRRNLSQEAIEYLSRSRTWLHEFGSSVEEAEALRALALAYDAEGDRDKARRLRAEATALLETDNP